MTYQEYPPHPSLTNYIKCLWVIERDFEPLNGTLDILPDSYAEVIFNTGSVCQIENGSTRVELPSCYLATLVDKPFRLRATGILKTIGVRFYSWGVYPLLGVVPDQSQPIRTLGSEWHTLVMEITALDTQAALDRLQAQLIACVSDRHEPERAVQEASRRLFDNRGSLKIDAVLQQSHLSRRQMQRQFQSAIHMSPKMLAVQIRFEQVRDALCHDPQCDLATLAAEYGYADQAHMSREFKCFSNRTLTQFIREIRGVKEELRYGVAFPH